MYDFNDLSPFDFEELVRDLLQAHWGTSLESFGPGRDGGVDLRRLDGSGSLVIQAKHFARTGPSGLQRALAAERPKALALRASRYLLATSVSMTPGLKRRIVEALDGVPLSEEDVVGREDLNNLLRQHPEIERRHFKLWLGSSAVLERIMLSGVYNRTAAELGIVRRMIPRFVQNRSVPDAERLLEQSGALIISGAPGVGKTTLAQMLLWRHAEQGWRIFVVDDVEEALQVAGEGERRLILFDDFLGQVRLSADHVRGLDARLPPLLAKVAAQKDLRFILTTRDYILAQARMLSARLSASGDARSYVLNVGAYTREVKARILYNHIHFSELDRRRVDEILADDLYLTMIDHKNFNPRLIEMLTRTGYLALDDRPVRPVIEHVLANPQELWARPYRQHMSSEARTMLLSLALNGAGAGPDVLRRTFARIAKALSIDVPAADLEHRFRSAFREVEGSAIGLLNGLVVFTNPGLRDFLQAVIVEDRLLPVVVPAIETDREIAECLAIHRSRGRVPSEGIAEAALWMGAYDRMSCAGQAGRYEHLSLALDLYDEFGGSGMLSRVRAAIDIFEDADMDGEEVAEACSLLERSAATSLPTEDGTRLRSMVTTATANMLREYADALSLEDIQSLDEALFEFGADEDVIATAVEAAFAALEEIARADVEEIKGLDDLDEYERNITALMARRGQSTFAIARIIGRRRDTLEEYGGYDRDDEYRGSGAVTQARMSDGEIRSIFSGLRD